RGFDRPVRGHDDHGQVGVLALDAADELDAVHAGQSLVGEHDVRVLALEEIDRVLAARRDQHVVPGHLERALERSEEDVVVFDEQDPSLHFFLHGGLRAPPKPPNVRNRPGAAGAVLVNRRYYPAGAGAAWVARGMTRRTAVPPPGRLSISISPLCRSMIFFTIAMPRPVPVGLVVKN